jgi:hypothetical protein
MEKNRRTGTAALADILSANSQTRAFVRYVSGLGAAIFLVCLPALSVRQGCHGGALGLTLTAC